LFASAKLSFTLKHQHRTTRHRATIGRVYRPIGAADLLAIGLRDNH